MAKSFAQLKNVVHQFFSKWILPDIAVLSFCMLLLGISWGAAYWQIEEDRMSTTNNVIQDNDKFSRAFEEHVRRILKTSHQYLEMLKREFEATQAISPSMKRQLMQMALDPVLAQATVVNSQGQVIASIRPYSSGASIADVPYFRVHALTDTMKIFIGKPFMDPGSDTRFVHMSQRLNNSEGGFAGVVTVAVDPGYFTMFYQDMDFDEKYVVRLVGMDGTVCASNTEAEIGADMSRMQIFSELGSNSRGFYRSEGELLKSGVLTYYRQMYDYPFVNQFGIVEDALLPMYQRRISYIGAACCISFIILLYAVRLVRSARRLRFSEANVQASYRELSTAHEELIAADEEVRSQCDELIAANQKLAAQELALKDRDEQLQRSCDNLSAAYEELGASEEELRVQYDLLLRVNAQVERQNTTLSLLQETAFNLLNKLDMEQLLQTIVSRAAEMVGAKDAFIALPATDESSLEVKAGIGMYSGDGICLPIRWGLAGKVYMSGKAQVVAEYSQWEGRASIPFAAKICSIFAAPLRSKRKIAGAFGVSFCEKERRFDEGQVILLERFAELASLALENAALHSHLQEELEKRSKSEITLREILHATNDAIIINEPTTGGILWTNPRAVEMFGYSEEELKRLGAVAISTADNLENAKSAMCKAICEGPQFYERDTKDKAGNRIVVEISSKRAMIDGKELCLTMMRDITQRKQMEQEIEQIQAEKQAVFDAIPDEMLLLDQAGRILSCHKPHGESARFIKAEAKSIDRNVVEVLPTDIAYSFLGFIQQANETGVTQLQEYTIQERDSIWHWDVRFLKVGSDRVLAMLRDVTAIWRSEERVQFLSLHDPLTEVYNRTYFEAEMLKMVRREYGGVAIMVCDVDGLKLINDTLGHQAGDNVLRVVSSILRAALIFDDDIVARIGGDEFAVILYFPHKEKIEEKIDQIKYRIASYNQDNPQLPVSLSVGWAADYENCKAVVELFKQADHDMYRQKLHQGQSIRSAIVQTMMKALEARDYITEGHAERLQELVAGLGRKLTLSDGQIADLRLLAKFHDIGKVGIPDSVLTKPGRLDEEETIIMRRHCEIGFRIAQASPDLTPIADCILKHQEWWNGQGYPLGISGAEIPLACRILALADAYDAMTNDRPYRNALSQSDALAEIEHFAGSQFDPALALLFVEMLRRE